MYTVRDMNGCKLVTGEPDARDLAALLESWGDDWVIDGVLSKALQVTLIVGPPARVAAWREELKLDGIE